MKSVLSQWTFYLFCVFLYVHNVSCARKTRYNTQRLEHTMATFFVPSVIAKSCLLIPDPGPCRGNMRMYYFDPESMNCSRFNWGGCMGNGNRFDTEDECMDYCTTKPGYLRPRPKWCQLTYDYGYCFGAVERWYYDSKWKVCKKTIYSGCGGNKNNFYNMEQCDDICRFGHDRGTTTTQKGGIKKVIILNPYNTTPKRGREQSLTTLSVISGQDCVNVTKKV